MASAYNNNNNVSSQQESLVSRRGPEKNHHQPATTTVVGGDHLRLSVSSDDNAQVGVQRIEAVSSTWSTWGLISAYVGCEALSLAPLSRYSQCLTCRYLPTSQRRHAQFFSMVIQADGVGTGYS